MTAQNDTRLHTPGIHLLPYHTEARTNWPPFADNIFKGIFFGENCCILLQISLMFVLKGPMGNKPALVWITDLLHKSHNAPVPHPTMHHFVIEMCVCVHISVTKWCIFWDICLMHCGICEVCLLGDKPLSEPRVAYSTDTYMRYSASVSYLS